MPHSVGEGVRFVGHHKLAAALAARREQYLAANASLIGARLIADIKVVPPDLAVEKTLELDLGGRVLESHGLAGGPYGQ